VPQVYSHDEFTTKGKYIWDNFVPESGQAEFVQGELLRAIEKLRDEAQRNANGNHNENCHLLLIQYLRTTLSDSKLFSQNVISKINEDLDKLKFEHQPYLADDIYDAIGNRIVDWFNFYRSKKRHEKNPRLNC
jgi:hypothetical protein